MGTSRNEQILKKLVAKMDEDKKELGSSTKDRTRFQKILKDLVHTKDIDLQCDVLIIGGSYQDAKILCEIGFKHITLTNLQDISDFEPPTISGADLRALSADAEDMQIADSSYDLVLAHEVLHHCRSPHRALIEMIRVQPQARHHLGTE